MSKAKGVVAAGHPLTAASAQLVLRDGGNAFDAAIASLCTACVVEPALASLGGGGFLMARPGNGSPCLYDFFAQTPARARPVDELDFRSITVDFGSATQDFHIGHGAVAVPGVVRGLFAVHSELGSIPIRTLIEPAVEHARDGVEVNAFQAYTVELLEAIFSASEGIQSIYRSPRGNGALLSAGETHRQPALADTLEELAREGADLFYRGDISTRIDCDMRASGGHLRAEDLARYRVIRREPLDIEFRGARLLTNPAPSSGGLLIAFGAAMLSHSTVPSFGTTDQLTRLAHIIDLTSQARIEAGLGSGVSDDATCRLLDPANLAEWRKHVVGRTKCTRGTTHISIIDGFGNAAALSVSNGEGSAYVVPGTGVSMNNMLGEEDLNPSGFHHWVPDSRMTSMMAPGVLTFGDGIEVAIGSGGSNRIRTAVLQVLSNLVEHEMDVMDAVCSPRLHYENGVLSVEGGFDPEHVGPVLDEYRNHQLFGGRNMFFGGTHTVMSSRDGFSGAGDPRRGGACLVG